MRLRSGFEADLQNERSAMLSNVSAWRRQASDFPGGLESVAGIERDRGRVVVRHVQDEPGEAC